LFCQPPIDCLAFSRTSKRGGAEQEDLLLASDAEQVNPTLGKIIMVWQVRIHLLSIACQ
jgi:hypothetical protein